MSEYHSQFSTQLLLHCSLKMYSKCQYRKL